jgi:hypothetical protein
MKLWRLSKIEGSVLNYSVHSLWCTYIGERRTTFAKTYGIKVRCYEEHVGEYIGNLGNILRTHWELEGNLVDHIGNQGNFFKNPHPHSPRPSKLKRKKSKAPWVHAWAFPLATWNFSSQKSWSPFLARAKYPLQRTPYPLNKEASGEIPVATTTQKKILQFKK